MRFLIALVLAALVSDASAGPLRNRRSVQPSVTSVALESGDAAVDALAEVNAERARRGLPAFLRDDGLTLAAKRCAETRARWGIRGHLANDFAALPSGSSAAAAGCGAVEPIFGFAACCTDGNYTYAGAATVWVNGIRFNHIFVR